MIDFLALELLIASSSDMYPAMSSRSPHALFLAFRPARLGGWGGLILLIGLVLRFTRSDFQSLWYDEIFSVTAAKVRSLDELLTMVGRDFHPPLYFVILRGWLALWGQSDLSARLLSGVIGALSLGMVAMCARDILGRSYIPIALMLAGTSLTLIWFSQEVRQYELLFLGGALCLHSLWRLMEEDRARLPVMGYVALTHGVALYTHYASALIFISEWVTVLILVLVRQPGAERRRFCRRVGGALLMAHLATFLAFSPWIPRFLEQLEVAQGALWIPTPTISTLLELVPRLFAYRLPWDTGRFPFLYLVMWMPISFVALALLCKAANSDGAGERAIDRLTMIATWVVVPIIASCLISVCGMKILFFRNLLFISPGLILLLSLASARHRGVMICSALLVATSLANLPWYYTSRHKEDWRRASSFIVEKLTPSSAVIFDAPGTWLSFDYYSKHTPVRYFSADSVEAFEKVLYVRSLSTTSLADISSRLGAYGLRLAHRKNFPGIIVLTYKRAASSP